MTISEFIARCDAYCKASGRKRVWLSKRLLSDTSRLQLLAEGKVDIGVKRLEQASADLVLLEQERAARLAATPQGAAA